MNPFVLSVFYIKFNFMAHRICNVPFCNFFFFSNVALTLFNLCVFSEGKKKSLKELACEVADTPQLQAFILNKILKTGGTRCSLHVVFLILQV